MRVSFHEFHQILDLILLSHWATVARPHTYMHMSWCMLLRVARRVRTELKTHLPPGPCVYDPGHLPRESGVNPICSVQIITCLLQKNVDCAGFFVIPSRAEPRLMYWFLSKIFQHLQAFFLEELKLYFWKVQTTKNW